jgi:transposase
MGFNRLTGERPAGAVELAFCWAHVRRKFFDFHHSTGSPVAAEALRRIAELYQIEARIRGCPPEARARIRQAESRALVDAMKPWLEGELRRISAKSALAEAIRYALRHWQGLGLFLDDGRVKIDSNTVDRCATPSAIVFASVPACVKTTSEPKFADSPLEERGFEPPVPLAKRVDPAQPPRGGISRDLP